MSLSLALQIVETFAVVVGVVFGLIQLRQLRIQREVQGGAELLRSMQSPQFAKAALSIYELPDDLPRDELKARLANDFDIVLGLIALFESMGPLVARGHVPIDVYADFYRGGTAYSGGNSGVTSSRNALTAGRSCLSGCNGSPSAWRNALRWRQSSQHSRDTGVGESLRIITSSANDEIAVGARNLP